MLWNFTCLPLLITQENVSLGACLIYEDPRRHYRCGLVVLVFRVFDVGEETSIPNLWLLYQFQDQKNAPSVTVPLHSGGIGTCARFGGFRKIADIPGLLCSFLAKEGSKLYVEM